MEQFKCRSIFFAAYLMCKYGKPIQGTSMCDKKVVFMFEDDGNISKALAEFSGVEGTEANVSLPAYMSCVNKLKDVARSITK